MTFQLRFLGTPLIQNKNHQVTAQLPGKAIGLLAFLAVEKQAFTRSRIANLLWSAESEARGKHNLRQLLQNIKKVLPHILVLKGRELILLNYPLIDRVDLWQFDEAYMHQKYQDVVNVIRGRFLEGLSLRDADNFDQWQRLQESVIHHKSLHALESLLQQNVRSEVLIHYASRLLALQPWHEEAYQQLMLAQARTKRFNEALLTFKTCREVLHAELGIEPGQKTLAVYERVERARHTSHTISLGTTNVFVGRRQELGRIEQLLANASCRCLTLLGMGGMGKTRLALEAGCRFQSLFLHGVCFVPLQAVSQDNKLEFQQALLNELKIESTNLALDLRILDYLSSLELLLILDNFEQLVSQASFISRILRQAPNVKVIVTSRNRLDIPEEWILDVSGLSLTESEKHNATHTLAIPGNVSGLHASESSSSEAVALLRNCVQQLGDAQADMPQAELGKICQVLSGVPLAIELIAPWLRTNSPAEILDLIRRQEPSWLHVNRNFPARHRSMFAVFEYSWQLLPVEAQTVMELLTCFQGDFSETAALTVAETAIEMLTSLVGYSMLQVEGMNRYKIHPLMQLFLEGKAEQRGTAVRAAAKHYQYFLRFATEMLLKLNGADQLMALKQCETEFANLRTAWTWGVENVPTDELLPFADFLFELCSLRNWFETGIQIFDTAHEQCGNKHSLLASRLLAYNGFFYQRRGLLETAVQRAQLALTVAQQKEDRKTILQSLIVLSNVQYDMGQYDFAEQMFNNCLSIAPKADFAKEKAYCLYRLGLVISLRIDYPNSGKKKPYKPPGPFITEHYAPTEEKIRVITKAREYYAQAQMIYQDFGDRLGMASTLHALGVSWYQLKAYDKAIDYFRKTTRLLRDLEAASDLTQSLNWLAWTYHRNGNHVKGRHYFLEALQLGLRSNAENILLDCLMKFALFIWVIEQTHGLPLSIAAFVANHPKTDSRIRNSAEEWVENISDFMPIDEQRAALDVVKQYTLRTLTQKILVQFHIAETSFAS